MPVLIDGPRAADALAAALEDSSTYRLIPAVITSPASTAIVGGQVIRSDFATFHPDSAVWGTLASYLCAYDIHTVDQNALALEATTPRSSRAPGPRRGPSGARPGRCPTCPTRCRTTS